MTAPLRRQWRYFGAIATIQVKNVPPDVHATLRRRAAEARQSLQEYVLTLLVRETLRPTLDEVLARAAARGGAAVSLEQITAAVREDRDRG